MNKNKVREFCKTNNHTPNEFNNNKKKHVQSATIGSNNSLVKMENEMCTIWKETVFHTRLAGVYKITKCFISRPFNLKEIRGILERYQTHGISKLWFRTQYVICICCLLVHNIPLIEFVLEFTQNKVQFLNYKCS